MAMLLVLLLIVPVKVVLHRERWQDMLAVLAWTGWPILSYFMVRRRWRKMFAKSSLENVDVLATVDERGVTLSSQGKQKCIGTCSTGIKVNLLTLVFFSEFRD